MMLCLACSEQAPGADETGGGGLGGPGSGAGLPGTGAGGAGTGGDIGYGGSGEVYTVSMGPIEVQPGVERTQCVVKRLGNPAAIRVGRIRNNLSNLSHHMILYRTSATEEISEPYDCQPFLDTLEPTQGSPFMVSQKLEDTLQLPEGVGFELEAEQMVRIELHYINTSTSPETITATAEFAELPDALFEHAAGFVFIGNPDITIPPMSQHTLGPTPFEVPGQYADARFFAITGHTHQWGTDVAIDLMDAGGQPVEPVYAPSDFDWEEPETVIHDPPFSVPPGGGFSFSCSWDNQSPDTVGFGESANQEMCFFWAYYYPDQGAQVCFHTDQLPGGIDLCCPGSPFCDQLF